MKRIICIIAVLVTVTIFMTACCNHITSDNKQISSSDHLKQYLPQIYEVDVSDHTTDMKDNVFNHANVISDKPQYTHENSVSATTRIQILEKTHSLNYLNTLRYPVGGYTIHEYSINGCNDGSVFLKEDGSLHGINCTITTLNISESDSQETVRAALEPAISSLVDLSKYQSLDIYSSNPNSSDFGLYRFYTITQAMVITATLYLC